MTVALIGGMVALYSVTIPLLFSTRKHAKSADEQVTNSHTVNLRDDMDEKHSDNRSRLSKVETRMGGVERRVGGVERGVQRIEDHLGIEHTRPRTPAH